MKFLFMMLLSSVLGFLGEWLEDRTALEALRTSSSKTSSLPHAERWKLHDQLALQPGPLQLALPSPVVTTADDAGECILVDSDDEMRADIIARLPAADDDRDCLLDAMVVFKVVHGRPARLKRPLQAEDDVGPQDIAFRKYVVLERDVSHGAAMRIRVARSRGADVRLNWALGFVFLNQICKTPDGTWSPIKFVFCHTGVIPLACKCAAA